MPEFPPSLIFTSALNSQFVHWRTIQNKWLASPSPTIIPSLAVQDSGFWLAFQPSRVFPSNILIQPLSAADRREAESRPKKMRAKPVANFFISIIGILWDLKCD